MLHIEGSIEIQRPVEDVFDFVADETNEPTFNSAMSSARQITPGPIGVGTVFTATVKAAGRPVDMVIEFTEYERPRRLTSATHLDSMDIVGTLIFVPVDVGTLMRWSWQLEPHGALRFLGPLVKLQGRRQELRIWSSLKRVLEDPE